VKQFEDYCSDLGDLEFVMVAQGRKCGVISLSDFTVLRNPPIHKATLPIIFKGKEVGTAMVVMQIVGSKLPQAVRHPGSRSIKPRERLAEKVSNDLIESNQIKTEIPSNFVDQKENMFIKENVENESEMESRLEPAHIEIVEATEALGEPFVQRHLEVRNSLSFEPLKGDFLTDSGSSILAVDKQE
jgi:hypothetical protein